MLKKIVLSLIIFILTIKISLSQEIEFESTNIDITENGNIIIAYDSYLKIPSQNIRIKSNKANYNKEKSLIIFTGNVFFEDLEKNLNIKSNEIKYEKIKDLIYTIGKTEINIDGKYKINSTDIFFDRKLGKIFGEKEALIEDNQKNFYILKDKFNLDYISEILKSNRSIILDKNYNKYIFEDLIVNLKNNEIAGNEIKVEFEDSYFGNEKNDPLLKGRSSYSNDDELKVYNTVFSTCNIKNKKCRGWELNTKEFKHDKTKKIFEYKNSWLKMFDYKVFFLPYFNHPDPTIKRKSGFLTPSYSTSQSLGTSFSIPYFKVISGDKDLTFNPRIYADKSFLLQNEYRQALKNSNILNDFSFLVGNEGSKGHFFYNQIGKLDDSLNFELNIQNVKGDNYLKNHRLKESSSLIKDNNLLLSNLDLNLKLSDASLSTSFKIFEDLSRNYNDRYQYVFPDFNFLKNINLPRKYNGNFTFNSYGYNKNYDTNVIESEITNDFLYSSNQLFNSKGIVSNYNLLLKNSSTYAENSTNFDEDTNYSLFGAFKLDASLPLKKDINDNHTHYLKPLLSIRYSPNGNNDISTKDILLNYDNVFNLNRIGTSNQVEGGDALSLGLEFKRTDNYGFNILDFKVANVLKSRENIKLPSKSKLNKTRSDIFGNINYNYNEDTKLSYFFSYDRDLEYSNLEQINFEYGLNNFLTNFTYYTEDNDIGKKENIKNNSIFSFDDENKLIFEITKDLKDDFTQYYDLIYEYQTDCISINLNYNKSFFRDGNLKPNKSLSFLIKIIPFTELGVPNVGKLINN